MKLLIVDDHAGTRDLIREIAGPIVREIHECENGIECLARYAVVRPDIVTLDLRMRPVDGFTTLTELKRQDINAHVVIVTQLDDAGLRRRAAYLGASAYIEKNELRSLRDYLAHFVPAPPRPPARPQE
jgi:DNA-binding NarL/FixJ family response regulator